MANSKKTGLIVLAVIVGLAVILGGWYVNTRNSLVAMEEGVSGAWSEVDNQLKRRSDLIPNLVATVKGYASHEEEVFTNIADARSKLAGSTSVKETAESSAELESALSRLLVVVENYPDLKANTNFTRLQDELAGTENRLTVARKRYNDSVKRFNTKIRLFPTSFVAGAMALDAKEYFEVTESEKAVPKVDFSS